ncbi:unnamed protein product [Pylaiella littoralis]
MMQEKVSEILRTVMVDKALELQAEIDQLVKFELHDPSGGPKTNSPAQAPKKGRHTNKRGGGATGSAPPTTGNPEGRLENSRRNTRMRYSWGPGSGKRIKTKK